MTPGSPTDNKQPVSGSLCKVGEEHPEFSYVISVYVSAKRQGDTHKDLIPWIASLTGLHESLIEEMVKYAPH